jgi:hypothetical protein
MEGINLEDLFPTDGIVPEERQIGRGGAIQRLTKRLVGGRNTLLLEPRRVGKTSVALAALQHARDEHQAIALHLDLVDGTRTPKQMVVGIVKQAGEQGSGKATARLKRRRLIKGVGSLADDPRVKAAAKVLEVDEVDQLVSTTADLLSPHAGTDVGRVLLALEADAQLSGRRVIVFIDEVQALAAWGPDGLGVQEQLAVAMRRAPSRTTFVFAGSKRHAVEGLFEDGMPLHYAGLGFDLDKISKEDWHAGLRLRFAEAGYGISDELIDDVLEASDGHPLRTMQVCAHVYEWAQNGVDAQISGAAVLRGIAAAQDHPSWKEADE